MKRFFLIVGLLGLLAACSTSKDVIDKYKNQSAQEIYEGGEVSLAKDEPKSAAEHFEALDALYPYNQYAEQAQLNIIYAYYASGSYAEAVAAADRYIRLYPQSPKIDYAYYMRGVSNFTLDNNIFRRYLPYDPTDRDKGTMYQAYQDFQTLLTRFPDSPYVPDARQRMIYLRNIFARSELSVAQYYMRRHAFVAAANRAAYEVEHYQQAPETSEALGIMVVAYQQLQLQAAEQNAMSVLKLNYTPAAVDRSIAKAKDLIN